MWEMKANSKRLLRFSLAVIFITGVFLGSAYDLQITSALSGLHTESDGTYALNIGWLAKLFAILGEWPSSVLGAISLLIVERNFRKKLKEKGRLVFFGVSTVVSAGLMFYGSRATLKTLTNGNLYAGHYIIAVIITIVLTFLLRFVCENISGKSVHRLFGAALFTAAAALLLLVISETLKLTWGRVRLTELVAAGSLDGFTPWYVPNFFSGSKSFPSGHTANATLLLLIPLWINKDKIARRKTAYAAVSLWIAAMAFSRLCAGAHYLTDVFFGFAIAYIIVELTYFIYGATFDSIRQTQNEPTSPLPAKVA